MYKWRMPYYFSNSSITHEEKNEIWLPWRWLGYEILISLDYHKHYSVEILLEPLISEPISNDLLSVLSDVSTWLKKRCRLRSTNHERWVLMDLWLEVISIANSKFFLQKLSLSRASRADAFQQSSKGINSFLVISRQLYPWAHISSEIALVHLKSGIRWHLKVFRKERKKKKRYDQKQWVLLGFAREAIYN